MMQHYQMLRAVSRTFALSIEQLPQPPRDALTLAYLLLRVSDGLEDHPTLAAPRKTELLRLWERVLSGAAPAARLVAEISDLDAANPEVRVAREAGTLLQRLEQLPTGMAVSILDHVRETTLGMARWQERGPRVDTEADLDDYMHEVAGRVGYLITDVFAAYSPAIARQREVLHPLAREFGLGLQSVNVLRGIRADAERGWVFVPRSFCARAGLEPAELLHVSRLPQALRVVEMMVEKAERHLRHGLSYLELLPRREHRLRLMCAWPLLFAVRTLARSRGNPAVLQAEAKIDRGEVRSIMRRALLLGWSNHWLAGYYDRLNPGSSAPGRAPPPPLAPPARENAPGPRGGGGGPHLPAGAPQAAQAGQRPTTSSR